MGAEEPGGGGAEGSEPPFPSAPLPLRTLPLRGFSSREVSMRYRVLAVSLLCLSAWAQEPGSFKVGTARRDITPREPVPMWGYGARHDALSQGVLDPLYADALVIQAGEKK